MGFWNIIKSHSANIYEHTIKHIKVDDIVKFQKTLSSIFDICKTAKKNHTCLGDCLHCDILDDRINEIINGGKK